MGWGKKKTKKAPLRQMTSKEIHRWYVDNCVGHRYDGGKQITRATVRWWCTNCGGYIDVRTDADPNASKQQPR